MTPPYGKPQSQINREIEQANIAAMVFAPHPPRKGLPDQAVEFKSYTSYKQHPLKQRCICGRCPYNQVTCCECAVKPIRSYVYTQRGSAYHHVNDWRGSAIHLTKISSVLNGRFVYDFSTIDGPIRVVDLVYGRRGQLILGHSDTYARSMRDSQLRPMSRRVKAFCVLDEHLAILLIDECTNPSRDNACAVVLLRLRPTSLDYVWMSVARWRRVTPRDEFEGDEILYDPRRPTEIVIYARFNRTFLLIVYETNTASSGGGCGELVERLRARAHGLMPTLIDGIIYTLGYSGNDVPAQADDSAAARLNTLFVYSLDGSRAEKHELHVDAAMQSARVFPNKTPHDPHMKKWLWISDRLFVVIKPHASSRSSIATLDVKTCRWRVLSTSFGDRICGLSAADDHSGLLVETQHYVYNNNLVGGTLDYVHITYHLLPINQPIRLATLCLLAIRDRDATAAAARLSANSFDSDNIDVDNNWPRRSTSALCRVPLPHSQKTSVVCTQPFANLSLF